MSVSALPESALERAVAALPDDELMSARREALGRFGARGFPTTREEDWKYTDLSDVADISRRWLETDRVVERVERDDVEVLVNGIDADWLVIANGELDRSLSSGLDASGVQVSALSADVAARDADDALADLNLALLRQGLAIRVATDRYADRPIGLLLIDTARQGASTSQVRIEIDVEPQAAARFLEYHVSLGDQPQYSNARLGLRLAAGARAEWLRFQDRSPRHSQTARLDVRLDSDAALSHGAIDLGGKLTRNDLTIDIVAAGADAKFRGLYVAGVGQHIDNHTRVDHRVGPARSDQEYRGVLQGRCRAVWNGKAVVHKGADGTDAQQANHNLLLSEHAEIDAKPELEIYADEVKCAHGTTVGQLDERAMFYLRSRGLDRDKAQRILTRAFAASVVEHVPLPELHERIGERVELRLRELAPGSGQ